jgi:hypothetical protein
MVKIKDIELYMNNIPYITIRNDPPRLPFVGGVGGWRWYKGKVVFVHLYVLLFTRVGIKKPTQKTHPKNPPKKTQKNPPKKTH